MVTIDGSQGEGGGQVLRTSLSLSAITGRTLRIENVRGGRRVPGLRPQHLTAVRAAAAICGAVLEGDEIGSQRLSFTPCHQPRAGEYAFDVADASRGGSAGSVGLVLQTVAVPLALADGPSAVVLRGGTHVLWAPSVFYLEHVFGPALAQMGIRLQTGLRRWGFYPAGGGEARFEVNAPGRSPLPLQMIERGSLKEVTGIAVATNLPAHIPQRMSNRATNLLSGDGLPARLSPLRVRGTGPGAAIFLAAHYENAVAGFCAYGRMGVPSERVADTACREFLAHHATGAPADRYLADQLLVPMALAAGRSELVTSHLSGHLRTNARVIQQFLDATIRVEAGSTGLTRIVVEGIGV